jgi:hypothetical protein
MMRLRVACFLSAFVCVAANAQECSGGLGGGMDATGNQCNVAGLEVDAAIPDVVLPLPAPKVAAQSLDHAAPARNQLAGRAAPAPRTTLVGEPDSRFHSRPTPPVEPVRTAKIEDSPETFCSGGVDGGMDATGNQCNPIADATGDLVIAHVQGR